MGLRIGTNVQSLVGQRALGMQRAAGNHELEKLSTGERIVSSADDAAGLAISEKFKAEIRSNRQAARNTQDAISLVQVAEGGLNEVSSMLIRMRELSIQSASDTLSDTERSFTDKEVQQLKNEIGRISQNTKFNGTSLLSGEGPQLEFQVGTHGDPEKDRLHYDVASASSTVESLGINDVNTGSRESSQMNLQVLDEAISKVSGTRANFGAMQNRLQSTVNNLDVYNENISAANSRIRDADVASESAELTKRNILTQAATATLAQANQENVLALKLIG
ncbi:MAG: flagellin FliC [Deltaproteobacteria bacterium]|nr:flagellin FliC [Deltaproteobacteria bacterium]